MGSHTDGIPWFTWVNFSYTDGIPWFTWVNHGIPSV